MEKNKGGRPREHDREQIAKDLIEWSKLDDSINLNAFCGLKEIAPSKITEWARECDMFRLAYENAKANLGARREIWLANGMLHQKSYAINARVYDRFAKEEHREDIEFEIKLKSKEERQTIQTLDQLREKLQARQEKK